MYRYHFNNGIWKGYAAFDSSKFDINQESTNSLDKIRVALNNNNFYGNSSYKGVFGNNWQITSGLSCGYSTNKVDLAADKVNDNESDSHLKLKLRKSFSDRLKVSFGVDYFVTQFKENFKENSGSIFTNGYDSNIGAIYTEVDLIFSKKWATKIGVRVSNNDLLNETAISPRVSFAYKMDKNSQFSFAYGDFTQTPNADYIKYSNNHQFESQKASHYILNFQYSKNGKTFRAETYYKDYRNLVKFDTQTALFNSVYDNTGSGYAKGLDVFWRDGKSIKNLEYWVSYSYIDSERHYKKFSSQVTPSFVVGHSLSIVTKYWINERKSQIRFTNS